MKPIVFKGCNTIYGKNQKGVMPLPAYKFEDGVVVTCWKMSLWETIRMLFRRKVWVCVRTSNNPLQPFFVSEKSVVTYEKKEK